LRPRTAPPPDVGGYEPSNRKYLVTFSPFPTTYAAL
jgi:hypothetical protein